MENHVNPRLGAKPLTQLTAADLRKLYDSLKQNGRVKPRPGQNLGLSSTTVHGIHTTLHHALKVARDQGLIPVNPADEVEPPKVIHQPMKILTEEQLDIFLTAIKADEFWYDFFYTELTTGLRRGEICGLMWTDLDERGGTLKVCHTLHRETGGRLIAGDTKTYAGTRKIVLPPSTVKLRKGFTPTSGEGKELFRKEDYHMENALEYERLKNLSTSSMDEKQRLRHEQALLAHRILQDPEPSFSNSYDTAVYTYLLARINEMALPLEQRERELILRR